ncbi:PP2C family protein-serine/threonine phosphatase [Streptacidiphilus griseoplanus]|uniref:PP2C family protein-serine/threonine phosphatase n=1 Tax=Peterkaempfera griseoplana TaxID=66896 RepID=UPI000AD6102A|nr:PP2C family protein-serine/threonine phosphatase [Peterkaempfera griseoplana]
MSTARALPWRLWSLLALFITASCIALTNGSPGAAWSDYSVFAPLLAAGLLPATRLAAGVILAVTAAVFAVDRSDGLLHSPAVLVHSAALVVVAGLVLAAKARHERDLRKLYKVWAVSEAAQRVLLRPLSGELGPLSVASVYRASTRYATVGGDLYAAARAGAATRLLIGDVRGKGLPAIEDASALLGAFRENADQYRTMPELAASLERSVGRHLARLADGDPEDCERFITALLVEIPDETQVVRVISCGHPAPLLRHDGRVTLLDASRPAPPLGLAGAGPENYRPDTFEFSPGDTLLLYTDGLVEARDATGGFYPVLDRAATWPWEYPAGLLEHISKDLDAHTGRRLGDDLAMVAVQHSPRLLRPVPRPQASPRLDEHERRRAGADRGP